MIQFEWDEQKAIQNEQKHHVTFSEATSVFYDPGAKLIHDPDHSDSEDRFVILGISQKLHLLVVCHCYRLENDIVRIISARQATKKEMNYYRRGNDMRDEYDFSSARENPYIPKLKKQITIRLDAQTIEYFKLMAEETGITYQNLINQYLAECAKNKKSYHYTFM